MEKDEIIIRRSDLIKRNARVKRVCTLVFVLGAIVGILLGSIAFGTLTNDKVSKVTEEKDIEISKLKRQIQTLRGTSADGATDEDSEDSEGGNRPVTAEDMRGADWSTFLINSDHRLDTSYVPDLGTIETDRQVDARIVEAATAMLAQGRSEGLNLYVYSAYRDPATQEEVFNNSVGERMNSGQTLIQAYQATCEQVALPGESEHASGLALDIGAPGYDDLDERQNDTAEAKWLIEHCADYGFILRYPPEKADITGILYEPWHFRYVGVELAKELTERGITLEEYHLEQHQEQN